jgi:hypothetical protein
MKLIYCRGIAFKHPLTPDWRHGREAKVQRQQAWAGALPVTLDATLIIRYPVKANPATKGHLHKLRSGFHGINHREAIIRLGSRRRSIAIRFGLTVASHCGRRSPSQALS